MVRSYDHRVHAGNAGDVWKHFILAEVSGYLLESGRALVYAESHAGRPDYLLNRCGEWTDGVGRCWRHLPSLLNFCYFRVLSSFNPKGLLCYPGSVRIVQEIARRHSLKLQADVWDIDPDVASAWANYGDREEIDFHEGDGFTGALYLLGRSPPGLLLIDPPYVDAKDASLAENLFFEAAEMGWTVLWWSMAGLDTAPRSSSPERFSLSFAEAGMECGRWDGATVAIYGADSSLIEHVRGQGAALIRVLKNYP